MGKAAGFIARWLVVIAIGAVTGIITYRMGYKEGQKKQEAIPVVGADAKWVAGVVWYSEQDQAWQFREFYSTIGGFGAAYLTETKKLEYLVNFHKEVNRDIDADRRYDKDCSFVVSLNVKRISPIPVDPLDVLPGSAPTYQIVEVLSLQDDFCFHCKHTPRARRE
jgi:hypothetical protein